MNVYCRILCVAVLLMLGNNGCGIFWFDKDVNCKTRLYITTNNRRDDTITFIIKDSSSVPYGFKTNVHIYQDRYVMLPNTLRTDSVDYSWTGNEDCALINLNQREFRVTVTVLKDSTVVQHLDIYPYDTTVAYQSICTDCWHKAYDTLIVE